MAAEIRTDGPTLGHDWTGGALRGGGTSGSN